MEIIDSGIWTVVRKTNVLFALLGVASVSSLKPQSHA